MGPLTPQHISGVGEIWVQLSGAHEGAWILLLGGQEARARVILVEDLYIIDTQEQVVVHVWL